MELAAISLENYKTFPGRESILIRPLTVFVGRNSSGKSVLARSPLKIVLNPRAFFDGVWIIHIPEVSAIHKMIDDAVEHVPGTGIGKHIFGDADFHGSSFF